MIGAMKELFHYRFMITNLVKRDLRGRYKGSVLGFLWNFVIPLMQILVYIMVFSIVFKQNIEHYYVYLIVGMVPWIMFSDSISGGSGSIIENSQLITKIYFPRMVIPISIVLSKLVSFLISIVFVFIVLAIGHGFDISAIMTPFAIVCLLLFSVGMALLLSALNVYMKDVQYMITVILMMWIWLTPIMYVQDYIDEEFFVTMLSLNPMTYIIELFQDALYWKVFPSIETVIISTAISVGSFILGVIIFEKLSEDFAEVL